MRIVRAAVAVGVLALLGLLVWDVVHGRGSGVAQKVDKGRSFPLRSSTCRGSTAGAG